MVSTTLFKDDYSKDGIYVHDFIHSLSQRSIDYELIRFKGKYKKSTPEHLNYSAIVYWGDINV
jgi:hypothetical protein